MKKLLLTMILLSSADQLMPMMPSLEKVAKIAIPAFVAGVVSSEIFRGRVDPENIVSNSADFKELHERYVPRSRIKLGKIKKEEKKRIYQKDSPGDIDTCWR
ncbi:MAG: hypothetical protein JO129_04470 [Candidatus Dependentiae bacterium]|nr:hypothetical protein [Candidatus Dependentiae bacterium]